MSKIESAGQFTKDELAAMRDRDNPFAKDSTIERTGACAACLFYLEEAGVEYCLWNVFRVPLTDPSENKDEQELCRLTSRGSPRVNLMKGLEHIKRLNNGNGNGNGRNGHH